MKYILITGGVISGVGKGIISSSLSLLLMRSCGLSVTNIKIDPYINIDAGTFSPYEHGEVFVLDDGSEVDLDLGNYERFLNVNLRHDNNITTGKIYRNVIEKERRGDFLGKTVQVIPHITDEIQAWVKRVAQIHVLSEDSDGFSSDGDTQCHQGKTNGHHMVSTSSQASAREPDVCVIELGGVVCDIESMPFVEAFRQFSLHVGGKANFCNIHVSLVPMAGGEHKTKPTQMSVRDLRAAGLEPDLLMCRCQSSLSTAAMEKLSMFCHVPTASVFSVVDNRNLYEVPLLLKSQGLHRIVCRHLGMRSDLLSRPIDGSGDFEAVDRLASWAHIARQYSEAHYEVVIGLVGKYVQLSDAYISMIKALEHAALHFNLHVRVQFIQAEHLEEETKELQPEDYQKAWEQVKTVQGVVIAGGFGSRGLEGKINAIKWLRINKKPTLCICLGMQMAVIEFCRNVLNWKNAVSMEQCSQTPPDTRPDQSQLLPVIIEMPEHNPGQLGGTMRLGRRTTQFVPAFRASSVLYALYGGRSQIAERHRHRFEVDPQFVERIEAAGMHFVGRDLETGRRMEQFELANDSSDQPDDSPSGDGSPSLVGRNHYFVGVQYHPEYLSRPLRPSAPYCGLILAAVGQLDTYLERGREAVLDWRRVAEVPVPGKSADCGPAVVNGGGVCGELEV